MRLFLTVLAVVVGLANAPLYNALGSSQWSPFAWRLEFRPTFTAHMLSAVLAGLIVSGALLLFADRAGFERGSSPVTCS